MKGLTRHYIKKTNNNLNRYFLAASVDQVERGLNWYNLFNSVICDIARNYNITAETAAEIFSALSPRNRLHTNLRDTINVVEAFQAGIGPDGIRCSTYDTNKYKAFGIMAGSDGIREQALKTFSFYKNCLLDPDFITIDTWHIRATVGRHYKGTLTRLRYEQLTELTLDAAKRHGVTGYQFQAIIWNSIRERHIENKRLESERAYISETLQKYAA